MKRYIFTMVIVTAGLQAYAQNTLAGIVTDAENNKPVSYASVGITSMPNGTVANDAGAFSITLNNNVTDNDTLKFSSIGYLSVGYLVGDLRQKAKNGPLTISLKKYVGQLKQVSVISKKPHVKILGYDKNSKLFGLGFYDSGVGSQAGIVITVLHRETNLQNLSFFIIQNPFKHLTFRVNLYEMVNNQPGDNILTENIFIHVDNNQTGKLIFDLSKYNIYLDKDALLSLEWIEAQPASNSRLAVAAAVFGHTYYRQASQSAWIKKGTGVGLSAKTVY